MGRTDSACLLFAQVSTATSEQAGAVAAPVALALLLTGGVVAVVALLVVIVRLASSSHPVFWILSAAWSVGLLVVGVAIIGYLQVTQSRSGSWQGYPYIWWERGAIIWPLVVFGGLGTVTVVRKWFRGLDDAVSPNTPLPAAAVAVPKPDALPAAAAVTCPTCGTAIPPGSPQNLCPRCLLRRAMPSPSMTRGRPTRAVEPPSAAELAALLPHLEVLELIGVGGMGAVYKARQPNLDRLVALKIVQSPTGEADPEFAARFAREARAMAKLDHPNIVAIHESGEAGGVPYLLMEYVDGITLREAMANKVLTLAEALAVVPQVCDALDYAHRAGVVHRDIKPENILIDQTGRVRIADFGLAKLADATGTSLTHSRQMMGTPHYMAPEQWERPNEVDHRADIYALGVILYELLTGELPLGRFDLPSQKGRGDARVDAIILLALAKEPNRRYQHAGDVKTALSGIDLSLWKAP